ncbi:hypothetical protein EJ05DRAFT_487760 [Pseudovirgaria hyperparasitica]|uniref:Uncharacterized protein n=1 Tax=Pseudovirgaria hyperparasitica TaxID=470096 RepID=A0A6A6VZ36_9PEZI|nr:uncharacterized protein EJ05DRAFT_487760 [Pseudovirgaria hyperparasitica]KAF2755938.1 hypothetical protein EJ05DRAFT_487760 [Pseudovirgaria hyperparasitica]
MNILYRTLPDIHNRYLPYKQPRNTIPSTPSQLSPSTPTSIPRSPPPPPRPTASPAPRKRARDVRLRNVGTDVRAKSHDGMRDFRFGVRGSQLCLLPVLHGRRDCVVACRLVGGQIHQNIQTITVPSDFSNPEQAYQYLLEHTRKLRPI